MWLPGSVSLHGPCPGGGERAVAPEAAMDIGDACVWEVTYYLRILLHILKLTSEYLSMLHPPALLTPKFGLWENLIACSE